VHSFTLALVNAESDIPFISKQGDVSLQFQFLHYRLHWQVRHHGIQKRRPQLKNVLIKVAIYY
jgi:hypothetical protein